MAKLLQIFKVQLKNNFVREAIYRTNFFTAVVVDISWILIEALFFKILYSNTNTIAGWTPEQTYFFLGIFFASDALFTVFMQRNFWVFSDLVNKGDLDILLTKPAPVLSLALTRFINITAMFNFLMGIGVAAYFGPEAGFTGGLLGWLNVAFWLLFGFFAAILLRFFFSIWIFWTERGFVISRLYYQMFQLANKPDTLYPKVIRYLILTVLPFAFIGSVPARAVLKGLSSTEYVVITVVMLGMLIINHRLWHMGMRRYQSASS